MVGQSQNVVGRGFVEQSQTDQHIGWNIPQAAFVTAVLGLLHAQIIGNRLLGQIMILAQILQSGVIIIHVHTCFHNCLVLTIYTVMVQFIRAITIRLYMEAERDAGLLDKIQIL